MLKQWFLISLKPGWRLSLLSFLWPSLVVSSCQNVTLNNFSCLFSISSLLYLFSSLRDRRTHWRKGPKSCGCDGRNGCHGSAADLERFLFLSIRLWHHGEGDEWTAWRHLEVCSGKRCLVPLHEPDWRMDLDNFSKLGLRTLLLEVKVVRTQISSNEVTGISSNELTGIFSKWLIKLPVHPSSHFSSSFFSLRNLEISGRR